MSQGYCGGAGQGPDFDSALKNFLPVSAPPVSDGEFDARLSLLQSRMRAAGIGATWLDASSSLHYFCGHALGLSERIHGALVPAKGEVVHVSPCFEEPKLRRLLRRPGQIATWEEDEDPFALIAGLTRKLAGVTGLLALDPATPYAFAAPLSTALAGRVTSAKQLIAGIRQIKSAAEIAIIQTAMTASWQVQRAVHEGIRLGMPTAEVCQFINAAHKALGMKPLFAAVQFGQATAYPHGVPYEQYLQEGDMVLVDMGAVLHGYCSDITRTWVYGSASQRQSDIWTAERDAHAAAFKAAQLGHACEEVDAAARRSLEAGGFGPGYEVPGLPHRTGHGLGLDIHEEPYIVRGNRTVLAPGMCFSIEPMLCLYGECGVRLEDIVFMTESGPQFFCPPSVSLVEPFGKSAAFDGADAM